MVAHKKNDPEVDTQLNVFQLRPPHMNVNQSKNATREEEERKAQVPQDELLKREELDFESLSVSEENQERKVLNIFKMNNAGAKDFDNFARGIQTWLSMVEMEAIRRYHDLHLGPIVEACEEYILRAAESLMDLIQKALLLSQLKKCRRAALEVARLALQAIEKMVEELDISIPLERFVSLQGLQPEPVGVE